MTERTLKTITQILLLSVIAVTPFFKISSLYFPFVSGKVYLFRALVMLAFFFWVWLMLKEGEEDKSSSSPFAAARVKEYQPNFKNLLVIALVLFFLAQVLVSFFGIDPLFSFFSSISRADGVLQYGFWVLYFFILISVFKKEKDWQTLFFVFTIVAFFISLFAWLDYPPDQEIYGNFFGDPAYFAGFLLFSTGFSLLLFERKFFKSPLINNLFLALALFFVITLIFTQIRGAFIGLAGGIFLFCLLSVLFLRGENKKLAFSCGIVLLLGFTSIILLFSARETNFVKNNYFLSRVTEITKFREAGSARERLLVWNIALKAFQEKPVFGYGPENFASAVNKYYDHRVGEREPWFDRAHNQPLDILATGGIVLFSFYLFWLAAVIYFIFKIAKEKKVLSFLLASIFLAYFLQGFFLFDVLATYLGLFPFLGFLVFQYNSLEQNKKETSLEKNKKFKNNLSLYILIPIGFFVLFVICNTCFVPYRANASALKFYTFTEAGFYHDSKLFLEESFSIKSPYTYWEVRKEAGWQFLSVLEDRVKETMTPKDIQAIKDIYDFIVPELERFAENRPYEPQIYYVLGRIYRAGFEKLGKDDLAKAEIILKKGLNYSDLRMEYFNELGQVLLLQGKFEEGEKLLQDYVERVDFYDYFPYLTLGHFYFEAEKYDLAMEQYEKAREAGYDFCQVPAEYSRYMFSAEKTKEYQRIVDMAKKYLERWGPEADTYFNIAVGYLNLNEKEKAKEFFLKAMELNPEYEQYQLFFID